VEGCQSLLIAGLDRDRTNVVVAMSFEDGLGIRPVGLLSLAILGHIVSGKKEYPVSDLLEASSPVVRGSTGLHENGTWRFLLHESSELAAADPASA
jgi:hypothetical protein